MARSVTTTLFSTPTATGKSYLTNEITQVLSHRWTIFASVTRNSKQCKSRTMAKGRHRHAKTVMSTMLMVCYLLGVGARSHNPSGLDDAGKKSIIPEGMIQVCRFCPMSMMISNMLDARLTHSIEPMHFIFHRLTSWKVKVSFPHPNATFEGKSLLMISRAGRHSPRSRILLMNRTPIFASLKMMFLIVTMKLFLASSTISLKCSHRSNKRLMMMPKVTNRH